MATISRACKSYQRAVQPNLLESFELWQAQDWVSAYLIVRVVGVVDVEHAVDRHLISQLVQHHELQSKAAQVVTLDERSNRHPEHLVHMA